MQKKSSEKIIIIGAGISGLAACNQLLKYGFDVSILEARSYAGGRIATDTSIGIPISCGAAWIHGIENNPVAKLASQYQVKMQSSSPNQFIRFDRYGQSISFTIAQEFDLKFDQLIEEAKKIANQSAHDIALSTALANIIPLEKFTEVEQDLFKIKLKYFQGYIGADYERLSARNWDQEEAWPGDNCFLIDSYQPIIDGLIQNCPIEFNTTVKEIHTQKNRVEIITENKSYYADKVIITLPLGVLKKNGVTFNPLLPAAKQAAIQNLGMGLLNVVVIKFPTVFWPTQSQALIFSQFDSSSVCAFINLRYFMQQPILLGYCGGETAHQLENFSDQQIIKKIMNNFSTVFGDQLPEPESFLITRWSRDPFSYGSYSYLSIGSSSHEYEALAQPVANKLFFAGEATSAKHLATTHGAYLSGIREANRINDMKKTKVQDFI